MARFRQVLGESIPEGESSKQGAAGERSGKRGSLKPGANGALPGERAHAKRGSIECAREARRLSKDIKEQQIAASRGSHSPQKGAGGRLSGAL